MKAGMLCLLLLSGCSVLFPSEEPVTYEYALTWFCVSREGCERTDDVARIDRVSRTDDYFHFTSTQDESFGEDAEKILSASLPAGCSRLYFLSLFGHELEPSRYCRTPGGFELELSIPNQDPTTHSRWLVEGRDLKLL